MIEWKVEFKDKDQKVLFDGRGSGTYENMIKFIELTRLNMKFDYVKVVIAFPQDQKGSNA